MILSCNPHWKGFATLLPNYWLAETPQAERPRADRPRKASALRFNQRLQKKDSRSLQSIELLKKLQAN
ncbi:hypothetical protein SRABI80_01730 [Peribacillus frigoritolerans]|uniref:hypothetical protein n=1 Tax=Peribacillus frigoritolerans TaxID=450367 RepID=UPI001D4FED98|nr:hypothetical protein [Peribacillus frigoritolerans]CAH0196686.1 hypothetical protein SRABI80_01730 [Peribacillus frigoritolerans]